MRTLVRGCCLSLIPSLLMAKVPGRFPPHSLVNTQVIARTTPVMQVIGMMRMVQEINRRIDQQRSPRKTP